MRFNPITYIEQFLNVLWTSEKRKKLWFYLTFLHVLLLVSVSHESDTPIHKNVAKFLSMMCFSEKETVDLMASLPNHIKRLWKTLMAFITRPISHRDTRGPPLLWTLSGLLCILTICRHILSFPAWTIGHTSLTAPFWKTGSPHYVQAFISGVQMSFARQLFPVHQ